MIRKLAWIALLIVAGYVVWLVVLNLPGHESQAVSSSPSSPPPVAQADPVKAKVAAAPLPATGSLIIPVAGVKAAQLVDSFNDKRGDGSRIHGAIDIMAPRGTPVFAAATGKVEKLFNSKLGGLTVYIRRSGGGWIDYYAHLDGYAPGLAEGQDVLQGQVIATVGSTGDASAEGPHLHFEIKAMAPGEGWWQGTGVDPYPVLHGR